MAYRDAEISLAKSATCSEPSDLYKHQARVFIRRLLKTFLDANQITPSELLNASTYQRRLQNISNVLEGAVQSASIAQTRGTDVKVTTRIKALHALIDDIVAHTRSDDREHATNTLDRESCATRLADTVRGHCHVNRRRPQRTA